MILICTICNGYYSRPGVPFTSTTGICDHCKRKQQGGASPNPTQHQCEVCGKTKASANLTNWAGHFVCTYCLGTVNLNNYFFHSTGWNPTGASPKANMSQTIRIWWDNQVQAYRISTPFNKAFVDALKGLMPVSDRAWDPSTKIWTVSERYLDPVESLIKTLFRGATVTKVTKAQAQSASTPPATAKASLDNVILQFVKILPFESAQKAYRDAAMRLHPDHGGDMNQMAVLNASWQRLESEFWKKI